MIPPVNKTGPRDEGRQRGRALLERAVGLHQQGEFAQAERLYVEAMAHDPGNADALHLLGMIRLQQNDPRAASELIRKAIALNNRIASYHFHHALALQDLNDMDGAVAGYRRALVLKPDDPDTWNNMGNALAAQGKCDEALETFQRLLARQPGNAIAHNNLGAVQKRMGRLDEAETSFRKAIAFQPGHAGAHVNLGNLHHDRNEPERAEAFYRRAIALTPRDANAHCGLGVVLCRLGHPNEAMASYQTALSLAPHNTGALINLGNLHWERGALEEAEALLARAMAIKPQDCEILNSMAALKLARGDCSGAASIIHRSLAIRETPRARRLFVQLARRADWDGRDDESRHILRRALAEPWDRPAALAAPAGRVIRAHPAIAPLVARAQAQWPNPISLAQLLGDGGFAALAQDKLLETLLTSAPNMDMALEHFLTLLRNAMLRELAQDEDASADAVEFASILARQCFISEYVFACDDAELAAAHALLETVVTPLRILLAGCYAPLHSLPSAATLLQRPWPAPVEAVLTQQLREPQEEAKLRAAMPRLTAIEDTVSRRVQEQYEENPYPRWIRPAPATPDNIANFVAAKFPLARFDRQTGRSLQSILIAGCGTGQRAIAMAQKFGGDSVLAVDLSLASLAYAQRMSQTLGLSVSYGQADILLLQQTGKTFDLIESLGVLHHLADPWEGWRRLLAALHPGGFMLLGLYSQSARQPVTETRARIRDLGLTGTPSDIRRFRQTLMQDSQAHASILASEDFFSLSACRDLLFHVHEQCVTLAQISRFVTSHGLHFLGFEQDDVVLAAYRQRFPQDMSATALAHWEEFERDHPGLFGGMYVFWIQKPILADSVTPLSSGSALLHLPATGASSAQ